MAAFLQTYMAQPGYGTADSQPDGVAASGTAPATAGEAASTGISPETAESLQGVSGATTHTGGFAVIGGEQTHAHDSFAPDDRSALAQAPAAGFGGGFGGGLASSPNVPAPGTYINPETGKPHTAGLTRAELEAIRAKGADLLDQAPHHEVARRSSLTTPAIASGSGSGGVGPDGRRLSDLTGREQAARQLTGTAGTSGLVGDGGEMTPGLELPGGWGRELLCFHRRY